NAFATSLDPDYANVGSNTIWATYVHDSLVKRNAKSESTPGLASAWRSIDDTHWEFTLRPDVKFSDGSSFGAADVMASIARVNNSNSFSSFRAYTKTIKSITESSPGKLIVETTAPDPLLPNSLSRIFIVSSKFKDTPVEDFNAGRTIL